MLRDKSVGIVGGAGYLGGDLAGVLSKHNRVRIIDVKRPAGFEDDSNLSFVNCDITNGLDCQKALGGLDIVFHRAGLFGNLPSMRSPDLYYRVNVVGTLNVLQACADHKVGRFLFDSTEFVYGAQVSSPVTEDMPAQPGSIYGASKLICEAAVRMYGALFHMPYIIFRFCRVRDRQKDDVIATLTRKILAGETVTLHDGGRLAMDFVEVSDVTRACVAAANSSVCNEVFNIGGGESISLSRIVETISEENGVQPRQIQYQDVSSKPPSFEYQFGPGNLFMSVDKAKSLLGWQPETTIDRSVRDTVKYRLVPESRKP